MPSRVIRQQLSLTPRQITALEQLAARLDRTKADLVREAVDRFISDPPRLAMLPRAYQRLADLGGSEPDALETTPPRRREPPARSTR
jgi:predicted DNA-binding protein